MGNRIVPFCPIPVLYAEKLFGDVPLHQLCVSFVLCVISNAYTYTQCMCNVEFRLHLQIGVLCPEQVSVWP